jgi:hypothetical protein
MAADDDLIDVPSRLEPALATMTNVELARLYRLAQYSLIGGTTYVNPKELFNEAVHRTLDGRRNWPPGEPFGAYIWMVMRSIADADRKMEAQSIELRANDQAVQDDFYQESDRLAGYGSSELVVDYVLESAAVQRRVTEDLQTIEDHFKDDQNVMLVIMAIEDSHPTAWRKRLKRLTKDEPELESKLDTLLRPPPQGLQSWRRQEALWKTRATRHATRQDANKHSWKEYLDANVGTLRDPGEPDIVTRAQYYLHRRMREGKDGSGNWSGGNCRSLIPEFGEPIARAFREGAVRFWRGHRPQLLSEGAQANSTPFSVIFGLTGLSIEAREEPDWPKGLSQVDVGRATRFALRELNGFPSWLPGLYVA